jgi:hypothetical protein
VPLLHQGGRQKLKLTGEILVNEENFHNAAKQAPTTQRA